MISAHLRTAHRFHKLPSYRISKRASHSSQCHHHCRPSHTPWVFRVCHTFRHLFYVYNFGGLILRGKKGENHYSPFKMGRWINRLITWHAQLPWFEVFLPVLFEFRCHSPGSHPSSPCITCSPAELWEAGSMPLNPPCSTCLHRCSVFTCRMNPYVVHVAPFLEQPLCVGHCALHFNVCHLIEFCSFLQSVYFSFPFKTGKSWGLARLGDLTKFMRLVSDEIQIWTWVGLTGPAAKFFITTPYWTVVSQGVKSQADKTPGLLALGVSWWASVRRINSETLSISQTA